MLRTVSLDDKYDLTQSHVLVTGYQALIRACLMQKERDRRAGLNARARLRRTNRATDLQTTAKGGDADG